MVSWTRLIFGRELPLDYLRYTDSKNSLKKPVLVWNITSSCNLDCLHCYLDAQDSNQGSQLSEEEARKIILDLAKYGVPVILFSGGEPLLRKDIFHLADLANNLGIKPMLSSNGTLITTLVAKKIKLAGFEYVGISIDGTSQTHDKLRGRKGCFKQAIRGIRNCQQAGIKIGMRFTLMRDNFKDLSFIFNLTDREGIKRLCIYHLVYSGRAKTKMQADLSAMEKKETLELIWKYTENSYKKGIDIEILTVNNHADGVWIYKKLQNIDPLCAKKVFRLLKVRGGDRSGISLAAIDHQGNVYADQFLRSHPLGNVCERKFFEIWRDESNSLLSALRNRHKFIKGRCKQCRFFVICNGNSRARAEVAFGDLWQEDPGCYLSKEEII